MPKNKKKWRKMQIARNTEAGSSSIIYAENKIPMQESETHMNTHTNNGAISSDSDLSSPDSDDEFDVFESLKLGFFFLNN